MNEIEQQKVVKMIEMTKEVKEMYDTLTTEAQDVFYVELEKLEPKEVKL